MITYQSLYREAVQTLRHADNPDAAFDVRCLMEKIFGLDRTALSLYGDHLPDEKKEHCFRELLCRRASGEPLQYLIGAWDFLEESFQIGPGVLIPRPETELLAQTVLDGMQQIKNPVVLDLCAGSGCLGLSIAKRRPDAQVFLLEKSQAAFSYLLRNTECIAKRHSYPVMGDLMDGFEHFDFPLPQVMVSNPPYIKSDEIAGLQQEVQREPHMALDGGEDGLLFYRALADLWIPFLGGGGLIAVECGEGQAKEIQELFQKAGIQAQTHPDYSGIPRIVTGWKTSSAFI